MSEESIVSIIVALISSLTGIIIRILEKRKSVKKEESNNKIQKEQRNRKVVYIQIIYMLCIVIAIGGIVSLIKQTAFPVKSEISITYPVSNDTVEQTTRVEGIYRNISENKRIWIFINPLEINRYYPQNSFAELDANGKWSSLVYFGQDRDKGKKFEIIVVLLNEDTIVRIQNYLKEAMNKQDWTGMEKIPENGIIYERKVVTRR